MLQATGGKCYKKPLAQNLHTHTEIDKYKFRKLITKSQPLGSVVGLLEELGHCVRQDDRQDGLLDRSSRALVMFLMKGDKNICDYGAMQSL